MTAPNVARDGSVGICTRGPSRGQRVLLVRDTRLEWWQLYLEPPWEQFTFGQSRFSFDNYIEGDDAIEAMMLQWGVAWLPRDEDEAVQREVFDMRSNFIVD